MNFQQIKPQKARGKYDDAMMEDENWIAEPKFDGDRRIMQIVNGEVYLTGTRQSVDGTGYIDKAENVPQITKLSDRQLDHLHGTVLDGEIFYPGKTKGSGSKYVSSIMGSKPAEAIRKQAERGELVYQIFDCLWFRGEDVRLMPLTVRWIRVEAAMLKLGEFCLAVEGYANAPAKREMWEEEPEGIVLKHVSHTYGNEKLWVKRKKQATADVVILGFTPGKGKFKGQIGAIQFGQRRGSEIVECGQCSGMDDATRAIITLHPTVYLMRVMEIKHFGREPSGHFRHPQFLRFRPDKGPTYCVWDLNES
jgi:ATP-dependent DNA ligase